VRHGRVCLEIRLITGGVIVFDTDARQFLPD
jgi:hypothetical protein